MSAWTFSAFEVEFRRDTAIVAFVLVAATIEAVAEPTAVDMLVLCCHGRKNASLRYERDTRHGRRLHHSCLPH